MGPRPQRAGGQPLQQEFQPQAQPQQFDPEFAGSQSIRSGQWGQSGQPATTGGMAQQGPTAGFAGSQQLVSQPPALYPEQFSDHLTEELRVCLDDCIDVGQVAAWSADKCAARGSEQAACAKLCNEVSTLGTVVAEFIARDARSVAPVIEAYVETAELALTELERFDEPHTEETAMVVDRSVESALEALDGN